MSEIIQHIARAAGISPILRGAAGAYIRLAEAPAFLSKCAEAGVAILGVETFDLIPEGIRPVMEFIADFSHMSDLPASERSKCSIAAARAFLDNIPAGDRAIEFEVVP